MTVLCALALFNNDANVEIKNDLVFLLVLWLQKSFYKACLVLGLLHLPHLDLFPAVIPSESIAM